MADGGRSLLLILQRPGAIKAPELRKKPQMKLRSGRSYKYNPPKSYNRPGASGNWGRYIGPAVAGAGAYLLNKWQGMSGRNQRALTIGKAKSKGKKIRHPYFIRKRRRMYQSGWGLNKYPKTSKKKVNVMKKYHMNGYVDTREINGEVTDQNCVYLAYTAHNSYDTLSTALRALFRKLFSKCVKYEGIDAGAEIPGEWTDDTGITYKVLLVMKNVETSAITIATAVETANDSTITSVAAQFETDFRNYANGYSTFSSSYKVRPFKLQLYKRDRYSSTATDRIWSFVGEIILEDLTVHVACQATIKMQNRTESASGSGDAENVSNNPLIGRRYITNGLPKTRDETGKLSKIQYTGVQLLRAYDMSETLKEPPAPGYFINIKSTTGIKLMPGEIRYGSVKFTKNMNFMNFLKLMRYDEDDANHSSFNIGPTDLYALEDAINYNALEYITVAYEVNRTTGVYFTEKKRKYSQGKFNASTLSNPA